MKRQLLLTILLPCAVCGCGSGDDRAANSETESLGVMTQAFDDARSARNEVTDNTPEDWTSEASKASDPLGGPPISAEDNPYQGKPAQICGDQVIQSGESCDPPGVLLSTQCPHTQKTCSASCQCMAFCGNAVQEPGELCDFAADPQCALDCQSYENEPPYGGGWTDPVGPPDS